MMSDPMPTRGQTDVITNFAIYSSLHIQINNKIIACTDVNYYIDLSSSTNIKVISLMHHLPLKLYVLR